MNSESSHVSFIPFLPRFVVKDFKQIFEIGVQKIIISQLSNYFFLSFKSERFCLEQVLIDFVSGFREAAWPLSATYCCVFVWGSGG